MEYAQGGEVFDFVFHTGQFSEPIARAYFQQLVEGLKAIHSTGFAHRDMKPENLLFDENFNLKITDFGFAAALCGRNKSGMLKTRLGTDSYMSPQLHEETLYSGAANDIFAAGVILFILVSQIPPFRVADITRDNWYKCFVYANDTF